MLALIPGAGWEWAYAKRAKLHSVEAVRDWLANEKERLPLLIPCGLALGIAFWEYAGPGYVPYIIAISVCLCFITLAFPKGSMRRLLWLSATCTMTLGFLTMDWSAYRSNHVTLERPLVARFYARILAVEHLEARDIVRMRLDTAGHMDLPRIVRVNVRNEYYKQNFLPGATILLRARLMPPAPPPLPGGYDYARRAWFDDIGATGSALDDIRLHRTSDADSSLADMRSWLVKHISAQMDGRSAGIAAALATGDTGGIAEQDAQAMRDSGLAHLLSISGLHVTAMVGGVFFLISRLCAAWSWLALRITVPIWASAAAALAAVGYTLLTGAQVPTIRSCIAALLVLTALTMGREPFSLRLVAAGAAFVLLIWPEALAGPSFQLSFAAVTTIIVLHELPAVQRLRATQDSHFLRRFMRGGVSLFITGLAIEIILTPIALYHFNKAGIYGAIANMIAIPLTTFVVMPAEALGLIGDLIGVGWPFWWVAEISLGGILGLAHYVASMPGAVTMRPDMPVWAYVAIIMGGLWMAIFQRRPRWLGLLPLAAGFTGMLLAPRPDILVTGDGRHLAVVTPDGRQAILRSRAGEYMRDMLQEAAGSNTQALAIEDWPGTICSPDTCVIRIIRNGRSWDILASRTANQIPLMELAAVCRRVDIAVSDRYLPKSCQPRWLKLDRNSLKETGGVALYLGDGYGDSDGKGYVRTVAQGRDHLPWAITGTAR